MPLPRAFFIQVFDDGILSSASGDANYTVTVTGTGGVNPETAYIAKLQKCDGLQTACNRAKAKARRTRSPRDKRKAAAALKLLNACKSELAVLKALAGL